MSAPAPVADLLGFDEPASFAVESVPAMTVDSGWESFERAAASIPAATPPSPGMGLANSCYLDLPRKALSTDGCD